MRELGSREHEPFDLAVRFTPGDLTRLPAAARELFQYAVDLLFPDFDDAAQAAPLATPRILIVFINVADSLGMELVASFAMPGGTIIGSA